MGEKRGRWWRTVTGPGSETWPWSLAGMLSTCSTYCYVMERLKQRGYPTRMIPGVTSFAAIAARVGESLVEGARGPARSPGLSPDQLAGLGFAGNENFDEIGAESYRRYSAVLQEKGLLDRAPARGLAAACRGAGLPGPAGA
ncbi:MAG: SAM-dependent methyltransferase [Evtepia sp.]